MAINITSTGNGKGLADELDRIKNITKERAFLDSAGQRGIQMLARATPKRTGNTASSWDYTVEHTKGTHELSFTNSNTTKDGIPIVVLLKNGHGTGTGGYVAPNDFVTPVTDEIIKMISSELDRRL